MRKIGMPAPATMLLAGFIIAGARTAMAGNDASITGKVIDRVTSEPIGNALVRLEEKASREQPVRDSTRTDAEGNYSFTGLPETGEPGGRGFGYIVIASMDRYNLEASGLIPLEAGENKTLDLSLRRILMMRVRVRESGSGGGIAGANVTIFRPDDGPPYKHASTDSGGGILFAPFQAGTVGISVAKPGFRTRSLARTLDGSAWEDTAVVALERDTEGTSKSLHGTVADPSGTPDAFSIFFSCAATDGEAWLFARPGPDGAWRMPGIPAECQGGFIHTFGVGDTAVSLPGPDTEVHLVRTPNMTAIRKGTGLRAQGAGKGAGGGGRDALGRLRQIGEPKIGAPPLLRGPAR